MKSLLHFFCFFGRILFFSSRLKSANDEVYRRIELLNLFRRKLAVAKCCTRRQSRVGIRNKRKYCQISFASTVQKMKRPPIATSDSASTTADAKFDQRTSSPFHFRLPFASLLSAVATCAWLFIPGVFKMLIVLSLTRIDALSLSAASYISTVYLYTKYILHSNFQVYAYTFQPNKKVASTTTRIRSRLSNLHPKFFTSCRILKNFLFYVIVFFLLMAGKL